MAVITGALNGADLYTTGAELTGPAIGWTTGVNAWSDREYGGTGTIVGLTEVQTGTSTYAIIGNCRVLILDTVNAYVVRQVFSDAQGNYRVTGIKPGNYMAIGFDPGGLYDAATTRMLVVT